MENSSFDFSSFSENPIMQYMTGGAENTEKTVPDVMIVGFVLFFFAGLFFFFSTKLTV